MKQRPASSVAEDDLSPGFSDSRLRVQYVASLGGDHRLVIQGPLCVYCGGHDDVEICTGGSNPS
jgi:hypothetical protein